MIYSANTQNVGQIFNTFFHLTREFEPFVKVDDLKVAFDNEGNVYLQGNDFQEQIHANFASWQEVRNEMRGLIAKHRANNALNSKNSQIGLPISE
ncbi:MAG: hypothetical protein K6T90_11680 [Leptolyngbyaceae cyanobacterium HOT.MB2.61]|nr:hypothetical protein [Leptolyngbyaceae cyanobacterium HOT.MB2.61]